MSVCNSCNLPVERAHTDSDSHYLCKHCLSLFNRKDSICIHPVEKKDLELVLAWRSNPSIYQHFRKQNSPLDWEKHRSWYKSRPPDRYDFIIHYGGRRVGVISISSDEEVSIYLGDFSAHGHGVATAALNWLCDRFEERTPLFAEIHKGNGSSKQLFSRCGFRQFEREKEWIKYIYES